MSAYKRAYPAHLYKVLVSRYRGKKERKFNVFDKYDHYKTILFLRLFQFLIEIWHILRVK